MKTHPLRHIGVALASTLVLSGLALGPLGEPATAQAAPMTVSFDNTNQQAVEDAYFNVFLPNLTVANDWSPGTDLCDPGTASQAARDAAITLVNYYRALAGLPSATTENPAATLTAQEAARLQQVNYPTSGLLDHQPPNTWTCWTQTAYDGSFYSNLSIGSSTVGQSIAGYMDDSTTNTVGHRRAILNPPQSQFGVGVTSNAYALQWMSAGLATNPRPTQAVAWPSTGAFPFQNLPSKYWSYSQYNVNFLAGGLPKVVVTKNDDTANLASNPVSYQNTDGGVIYKPDSVLVWTMPKLDAPAPGATDIYHVTITGSVNATYDVPVFSVQQKVAITSVSISGATSDGTASVGTTLTASASGVNPSDANLSYAWYRGTTQVGTDKTYTTGVADAGGTLTVKVTASKDGWTASDPVTSSTSVSVDALKPLTGKVYSKDGTDVNGVVVSYNNVTCDAAHTDITSPDISGTVTVGSDGAFTFGTLSGQCYAISVASPSGLIVNSGGSEGGEVGYSMAAAKGYAVYVSQVAFDRVQIPTTVTVGQSIKATLYDFKPETAEFTYQWYRDDAAISGATDASYTVTSEDNDHQLTVQATATSGTGHITRTSNPATVGLNGSFTFTPPINGTPVVGETLTTSVEDVPAGWTPSYKWLSGGVPILGATSDSYILVAQDANTNISVQVTLSQPGYESSTNLSDSVVVKARYSVTFNAQNGTDSIVKSVVDGGTVSLPAAPTKDGYVFDGWFPASDGTGTQFTATTPVTADTTVYAKWIEENQPPVVTYTVTYRGNGGTGAVIDQATYKTGDPATVLPNTFVRDGYTFAGWKDTAGTSYSAGDTIQMTGNVTLTAQWNEIVKPPVVTYTVSYNANGGTGTMAPAEGFYPGDTATTKVNTFSREGYTFTGWNTAADGTGTGYSAAANITMNDNVTLYAQWVANTPTGEQGPTTGGQAPTTGGQGPTIPGGGTTTNSSMLILIELGLIAAGLAVLRLRKTI